MNPLTSLDRVRGSLLGGAVGDALGEGVEFFSLASIRREFGPDGVTGYPPANRGVGMITDDTQMTLFTAEGLMRAWVREREQGAGSTVPVIHHAYLRWLATQGQKPELPLPVRGDGWLFAVSALHDRRAPGNTCLSALVLAEGIGTPARARNQSKGCGGVMRVAPVGLFASAIGDDEAVFALAAQAAALTHGHPTGFLAAGHLATTIARLMRGEPLPQALDAADAVLKRQASYEETARAVAAARQLAAAGRPTPEAIETLGGGWIAEEALAIAICCALVAEDFADGALLAVNHSGDSDSTGAITGNLLGARWGAGAIPDIWLAGLELRGEIDQVARDLDGIATGQMTVAQASARYPGW